MLLNQLRALDYMQRYRLDVLVATSPTNITYFTDYYLWLDRLFKEYMVVPGASSHLVQYYAVFPLEGEPALVVNPLMAVNAANLWVRNLQVYRGTSLETSLPPSDLSDLECRFLDLHRAAERYGSSTEAFLGILNERGLSTASIGIEMEGLEPKAKEMIARALPKAEIKDCSNLIRLLRMVKSKDEITLLKRAAEINEQAAMESLAMAGVGRHVADLVQHFRQRVAQMGADFDHFDFSLRGLGIASEPDYILRDDDVLFVDFGCIYRHYFSDGGTTLALRKPSDELLRRHAAFGMCLEAGTRAMHPGAKASDVHLAMGETLKAQGITSANPHGHGIGLEVRDYPILVGNNGLHIRDECVDVAADLPLEEGMVLNLESSIFMPAVGALQMEKSYLVTTGGGQPLVTQDRSSPFIVAE